MLQKLKELQQTCRILSELYYEYRCIYYRRDFSSSNLDYLEIPFSRNWSFAKFIRMDFNFDEEKVIINYDEERFFIPIELIGKPRKEIEKWYKEKIKTLKRKKRPTMKSIRMFNKSPFVIYHTEENHKRLKKTANS